MADEWIDIDVLKQNLSDFFRENRSDIRKFGDRVNQTFEAFVFASLIKWYSKHGWQIEFKHPKSDSNVAVLKYSTRGKPSNYTYALCTKNDEILQIRHSLRVATKAYNGDPDYRANLVLDVAVISHLDLSDFSSDDFVNNNELITFAEAKHMSAFAELIANFIGLVHELKPDCLDSENHPILKDNFKHPSPFLYVSGILYPTAQGIVRTIEERGYDIEIYHQNSGKTLGLHLPKMPAKQPSKSRKKTNRQQLPIL